MFEKEAEDNKPFYAFCTFDTKCELWKDGFQKGAKFGYNKANEWHEIESETTPEREISKQYMPKNKEKVLLKYRFFCDDEIHISDGYYDAYYSEFHIANKPEFRIAYVIAWREFPKKENE